MNTTIPSPFLRKALLVDAATCAISGALMSLGAPLLSRWTALPSDLLFYAGLVLFPIALFMAMIALRSFVPPTMVWLIIAGNLLWVAGCVWLLVGGDVAPNALGQVFIAAQALAVAALTKLEHDGLRRSRLVAA
jgi:predicted membrane channel-forming protein YqfA (hemolysin III family)